MEDNKYGLMVVAIIAVVAIFGFVTIKLGEIGVTQTEFSQSNIEDLSGDAAAIIPALEKSQKFEYNKPVAIACYYVSDWYSDGGILRHYPAQYCCHFVYFNGDVVSSISRACA